MKENLLKKIETFLAVEARAIYAFDIKDWQAAEEYYGKMLQLADGWLSMEDPNVLFVRAHYSECLMHLGRDEEASNIQVAILKAITPPDTDHEKHAIIQLLHLRIELVDKLRARKQNDEALKAVHHAYFHSKRAFGVDDDNTKSLDKSFAKISKQIFEEASAKLEKDLPRLRPRRDMQRKESGTAAIAAALLPSDVVPAQQGTTAALLSDGLEIHVAGPPDPDGERYLQYSDAAVEDESKPHAAMLSPNAPYIVRADSIMPKPRLSSMPSELPHDNLKTSTARESRIAPNQLQDDRQSRGYLQDEGKSSKPLSIRPETRSRSVNHGVPENQVRGNQMLPDRPVKPNISDAALLSAPSESENKDTDKWFSEYLKRVHILLERFTPMKADARPKIAILDTGLNTDHPEVRKIYKPDDRQQRRIKGVWKPTGENWLATEDVDGHGTHCAIVAHKVAPNAEIYTLRVFRDRHHVSGEHIVEAITHAVENLHVDIISMSFALDKYDTKNKDAITKRFEELKDKVLFFAAASNNGPIEERTYPAKRPEVIAVHAAHGRHKPYDNNPRPWITEVNIGALGMYVSAPHKGTAVERLSGTSVACAVAVGIAALVIEFCRQKPLDNQVKITNPTLLNTNEGMRQIFMLMRPSDRHIAPLKDGELLCLQPWNLMSLDKGEGNAEVAKKEIMEDIVYALGLARQLRMAKKDA